MRPDKDRSSKKRSRPEISSSQRHSKKLQTERATDSRKSKSHKKFNKGSTRSAVELVEHEERELSEEDFENFDDYEHFRGFLQTLDPKALARKAHTGKIGNKSQGVSVEHESKHRSLAASEDDLSYANATLADSSASDSGASVNEIMNASPVDESDHEANVSVRKDYEALERNFSKYNGVQESDRLPIKLGDGRIKQYSSCESGLADVPGKHQPPSYQHSSVITKQDETDHNITTGLLACDSADAVILTQEKLAQIALEIIENPEENISQLSRFKDIQNAGDLRQKRLTILTLSAVFKDIIPGYRIRPLTDLEKAEKVTAEIRKLRHFEQTLVSHYRDFVNHLVALTKTPRRVVTMSAEECALKSTAVTAACSLLKSSTHFNFRTELFNILVSQVCRKTIDDLFLTCRATIEELFREDDEGEASSEGMRLLCKKLKDREYQVHESTIATFLHLRLLTDMQARGSSQRIDRDKPKKKERQFRTKNLKKLIKDQKEVDRDMREAEANINAETRERLQGEILKLTFTTYLRILKDNNRAIIGAALEGLAKFATLINVDFFGDLLEVLKELMSADTESRELSTRANLLCITTAFTLLDGQAATKETINLDLSKFMDRLYRCMVPVALNADIEMSIKNDLFNELSAPVLVKNKINVATEIEMLLRALDAVFFRQKLHANLRMTALVKRFLLVALHFPEKSTAAALELVNRVAARYSKLYGLFATEESARDGLYDGTTNHMELCNANATSIWELSMIRRHFSPKVRTAGTTLLQTLQDGMLNRR